MSDCKICYNKIKNKLKCKSNCKNNDTDICNNCIINLSIKNINLIKGKILIDNEYVKNNVNYNDIIIYYNCPYCNKISNYKLTEILDRKNLIQLSINILKYVIIELNKKDLLIENLNNKNNNLKLKLENNLIYKKYMNRCNILSIIICMKLFIIFLFVFLNKYTIYIK